MSEQRFVVAKPFWAGQPVVKRSRDSAGIAMDLESHSEAGEGTEQEIGALNVHTVCGYQRIN